MYSIKLTRQYCSSSTKQMTNYLKVSSVINGPLQFELQSERPSYHRVLTQKSDHLTFCNFFLCDYCILITSEIQPVVVVVVVIIIIIIIITKSIS